MKIYEGSILTCDGQDRVCRYLVEDGGRIADMVILSGNPYETDVTRLDTLKVEQLLLQGEPYRKIAQNPIGQVLTGLVRK